MKIVCPVTHDAATLSSPRPASRNSAVPCAACARTSTMPTAARLATHALSVRMSLMARPGSSSVARSAVASPDMGQTAACAFMDSSLGQASEYRPARSANGSANSILLATRIACRQAAIRPRGQPAGDHRPFCGPLGRQYDLVSSGFTGHGCLAMAARIRRDRGRRSDSSRRSESHRVSCAACRRQSPSSRQLDPAAGTPVVSFRRADA